LTLSFGCIVDGFGEVIVLQPSYIVKLIPTRQAAQRVAGKDQSGTPSEGTGVQATFEYVQFIVDNPKNTYEVFVADGYRVSSVDTSTGVVLFKTTMSDAVSSLAIDNTTSIMYVTTYQSLFRVNLETWTIDLIIDCKLFS
jgi:hypothetical protein